MRHGGPGRRGRCTSLWAMSSRHILTAPAWPYANGPRHIGHVSGFGLPADMFARSAPEVFARQAEISPLMRGLSLLADGLREAGRV